MWSGCMCKDRAMAISVCLCTWISVSYSYVTCVSFSLILSILKLLSGHRWDLQNNIEDIFSSKYCPSYMLGLETLAVFSHTHILSILKLYLGTAQRRIHDFHVVFVKWIPFSLLKYTCSIYSVWGISKVTWLIYYYWILGSFPQITKDYFE